MVNGGNNARLEGAPFTPFYGAKVRSCRAWRAGEWRAGAVADVGSS
jgi:hypothetical protein